MRDEVVTRAVISAHPGYSVGYYCGFMDHLLYSDIIAWEIQREEGVSRSGPYVISNVYPITLDGVVKDCDNDGQWCIRTPDGKYIFPGEGIRESEPEVIAFFEEKLPTPDDEEIANASPSP